MQLRPQEIDNFLCAVNVRLEVPQVGVAVAIFFTADFARGHFFNQARCAAHHFRRREGQFGDAFLQLQHVTVELIGVFLHPFGSVIAKQGFFQTVEAGEFRIGGLLLIVVFTGVNAAIEVREQLGNRLDALVVLTGWRIQGFRFFDIARFHRIGKGFGTRHQVRRLFGDVGFIGGNRVAQAQQRCAFGRIRRRCAFDDQLTFRVSQQAAGHLIFPRLKISGHLLAEAWRDILTLFHHHHAFEDLPLQRFLAVVLNNKLGFAAVDGDGHRLALLIVDGDFYLRNICRLSGEGRSEQRGKACA